MKKPGKTVWLITLICVLLGFFTTKALDAQEVQMEIGGVTSLKDVEKLINEKKALEQRTEELDEIIAQHESELTQHESRAAESNIQLQQTQREIQDTRLTAGLLRVEGPGIEIILSDRKRDSFMNSEPYLVNYFIVHDSDMLHVINELRGAGAEAISINGTRIMETSRISCGGPTINVGKAGRFAPPFVIKAIGDPDVLIAGFQREDSIYHDLIAWGLEFQIHKVDSLEIPRYLGEIEYTYAKAVQEDE